MFLSGVSLKINSPDFKRVRFCNVQLIFPRRYSRECENLNCWRKSEFWDFSLVRGMTNLPPDFANLFLQTPQDAVKCVKGGVVHNEFAAFAAGENLYAR